MILFFDTSALVKFFHREEGTDVVVSIISDLKKMKYGFPSLPSWNSYVPSIEG